MAVPVFVSSSTIVGSGSAASLVGTLPGSRVNGNMLWTFVEVLASGKTLAASAGWTIVDSDNTNNMSGAWAWRIVDGTETACTWSWAGAAQCNTQCHQYSGNAAGAVGNHAVTSGTASPATAAAITSTADNSRAFYILICSNNVVPIVTPAAGIPVSNTTSEYATSGFNGTNGSYLGITGTIFKSGTASDAISASGVTNWKVFAFEMKGSGATVNEPAVRSTQVVQQMLESNSRVTQVRTTQVVIQVLRSVSPAVTPASPNLEPQIWM